MTTKVFLSYASQDKQLAESAKRELEGRGYVPEDTVFFDASDISVGEDIRARLKSEMEESATVVLVVSNSAASSERMNYEAGLADALGKKILIVSAKGAENSTLFGNLADYQRVDLDDAG